MNKRAIKPMMLSLFLMLAISTGTSLAQPHSREPESTAIEPLKQIADIVTDNVPALPTVVSKAAVGIDAESKMTVNNNSYETLPLPDNVRAMDKQKDQERQTNSEIQITVEDATVAEEVPMASEPETAIAEASGDSQEDKAQVTETLTEDIAPLAGDPLLAAAVLPPTDANWESIGIHQIYGYNFTDAKQCGKTVANGITASGLLAVEGVTVAMSGFPFGTVIYIEGVGERIVQDRGVKAGIVDMAFDTDAECYAATSKREVWIKIEG
jgi:3D (Asp-Asp-Asp) domain-containing protein